MSGEPPGARVIHIRGSVVDPKGAGREQIDGSRAPCLAPVTRSACAGTRNDGHPHGREARQLLPGGERSPQGSGQAGPSANNRPAGSAIGTPVEVSPLAPTKMYKYAGSPIVPTSGLCRGSGRSPCRAGVSGAQGRHNPSVSLAASRRTISSRRSESAKAYRRARHGKRT